MARIRTIKPEFPQSESMGNVSRDSRLTFMLLWTLADDEGRLRGNSRMLASLLFPYDDDAPRLVDNWLGELEREECIVRYKVEGANYIQVCKWLIHQKIDKPSKSKIPQFDEHSRILANPREPSCLDQGSRIKDQGEDQGSRNAGEKPEIETPSLAPANEERRAHPRDDLPEPHQLPKPGAPLGNGHPNAGDACLAMKKTGIGIMSAGNPTLNALMHEGVTIEQLVDACKKAVEKGKNFTYALAIAKSQAMEARGLTEKLASAPVKPKEPSRFSPEAYADQPAVGRL